MEKEETLQELMDIIRGLKQNITAMNLDRVEAEKRYKLKFAYDSWKSKEGLCWKVTDFDGSVFYCKVITVFKEQKIFEYINEAEGWYALDSTDDPKQDCGYQKWIEISKDEYAAKKFGKELAVSEE